ncbi:hypothetical protein B0H14DRAFT_2592459 [Mycena olivaceomarginata]|nr:hypothetical protein B0H14DRAFT_2592459 [Mycena olivaceomarginata]
MFRGQIGHGIGIPETFSFGSPETDLNTRGFGNVVEGPETSVFPEWDVPSMDSQLTLVPAAHAERLIFSADSMKNTTLYLDGAPAYTLFTDAKNCTELGARD